MTRILIVDDDLHSREGLRKWLLGAGYCVETAADGWQAIKKMKAGRYDVAITDLDLPVYHGATMTGWDVVRILRAYNPAISIIALGAEDSQAVRTLAEELGVSECLVKPINLIELKAIVGSVADVSAPSGGGSGPGVERRRSLVNIKMVAVLILVVALATTGCAGLTAREKGALIGGTGGAAGGALFGAAAGNAAVGAAIGGPLGLLGGYLLGDRLFRDDPGRK